MDSLDFWRMEYGVAGETANLQLYVTSCPSLPPANKKETTVGEI